MNNKNWLAVAGGLGMLASWAIMLFQGWVGDKQLELAVKEQVNEELDRRFKEQNEDEEEES